MITRQYYVMQALAFQLVSLVVFYDLIQKIINQTLVIAKLTNNITKEMWISPKKRLFFNAPFPSIIKLFWNNQSAGNLRPTQWYTRYSYRSAAEKYQNILSIIVTRSRISEKWMSYIRRHGKPAMAFLGMAWLRRYRMATLPCIIAD